MARLAFGVRVPNSGPLASVDHIVQVATAAEAMGFDSVWVHDHVVWSGEMHRHHISSGAAQALAAGQEPRFYEALTTLAYLAGATRRVRLGVACLVLPCRNPIYVAKQAANVDWLSGGRLIVGVGLGSRASRDSGEFEAFGVAMRHRARMTDEFMQAIRALWTQPRASFEGRYVRFKDVEMFPKPLQRPGPPLWVGGWTDAAAERAARYGDGWIPGWLSPDEMRRGREHLVRVAESQGRDPSRITVAIEKLAAIAPTRQEAMELALPTIEESRRTYERDVDSVEFALERHIIGSVDDVRRRVEEFAQAGVEHVELKLIYPSMDSLMRQMELWARHILPIYR